MRRILLLFAFCSVFLSSFAQHEIKGQLVDENGEPVAFASIVLKLAENDSVSAGTISDANGLFSFNSNEGKYVLVASAVGFETLKVNCGAYNLGELLMPHRSELLNEVTVEASHVEELPERFVVYPDSKEVEAAGLGLVLLDMQQLPGLNVDVSLKKVTVDGGAPVLLVNGKEVTVERFINVKPERIKRIEYSNNPGIRYLDRGASGVINLVLKEAEDGGSIIASGGTAVTTGFADGYFMGSYHKRNSEISLQYSVNHRNYDDVPYIYSDRYISDTREVNRDQTLSFPFHYTTHNITAEYTLQINDTTSFIVSLRDYISNNHWQGSGTMIETDNGTVDTLNMKKTRNNSSNMPVLDVFFSHQMKDKQRIELNLVGQYSNSMYDNLLVYTSSDNNDEYFTKNKNLGYSINGEGVYSKQFNKIVVRFGLQYQHNFAHNDYQIYQVTTEMIKDNAYLFYDMQGRFGPKVGYSLGTGVKYFTFTDDVTRWNYFRNLTSIRINWRINDNWSITVNGNLKPSLPSLAALSPVLQRVDDVEANMGNESLKPSNQLSGRAMVRYNHSKGLFVNAYAGCNHHFSPIVYTYCYDSQDKLFISSPKNADYYNCLYFTSELGVQQLFKHFNVTLSGTFRKDSSCGEDFMHTYYNFSSDINMQAIWEKIVFGCEFGLLPVVSLYGEDLSYDEMSQNIYIQYNWKDFYVSLIWHCPFNKDGYKYESKGLSSVHPYYHANWTANNGNMIVLGLAWQMNYGKSFKKSQKTLQNGGYDDGMVK